MNRLLRSSVLVISALAAVVAIAWMRPVPPPAAAPESLTKLERIYAPFDTIGTVLGEYRWPLQGPLATTSVFGDYRSTHFHGGIDVSTQGREGVPVRAMRDGWVSLVRISPHGYGKVVEVTHEDGFTTWYAHLRNFAPYLDSLIRRRQEETSTYAAELRFDEPEIPVAREEIIAFTGSTGAGGPHLHFEIRDARRNPVNPLLASDIADHARDRVAPAIDEVGVLPLTAGTLIQGNSKPLYVRPQHTSRGELRIGSILRLTGDVGFTVRVRDGVGVRAYRNRMASLELQIDGATVYESSIARLPADDTKQIALHFDWTARANGHPYHQKLFVEQGNRLPFYARLPHGSGMLQSTSFSEGAHELQVVARDLNGNSSRLRATVIFNHPPRIRAVRDGSDVMVSSADPGAIDRILVETSSPAFQLRRYTMLRPDGAAENGAWHIPVPHSVPLLRVTAQNSFGTASDPVWLDDGSDRTFLGELNVETEFFRDYAYVHVRSPHPLTSPPRVRVLAEGQVPDPEVRSLSARHFFATFPLTTELGRSITVEAVADLRGGSSVRGVEEISLAPVTPAAGGVAALSDAGVDAH
ncbi:MAG: M23 family metallopeptidase [Bacteroidota bacterium]